MTINIIDIIKVGGNFDENGHIKQELSARIDETINTLRTKSLPSLNEVLTTYSPAVRKSVSPFVLLFHNGNTKFDVISTAVVEVLVLPRGHALWGEFNNHPTVNSIATLLRDQVAKAKQDVTYDLYADGKFIKTVTSKAEATKFHVAKLTHSVKVNSAVDVDAMSKLADTIITELTKLASSVWYAVLEATLCDECVNSAQFGLIYSRAYDAAHSDGYDAVYQETEDLMDFIRSLHNVKECNAISYRN